MKLSGYETIEKVYEGNKTIIYRARRLSDNQTVIAKVLNEEFPTKSMISRFKYEYEILQSIQEPEIISVYALEQKQNNYIIVQEAFGKSLKQYDYHEIHLLAALKLFIQTANAIEKIHTKRIIHKDINPANILYDSTIQKIKLIDFGISTKLSFEKTEIMNPDLLEGTLAYISPEQTGRMNRAIDYRTDYYSMGVTFYEVLTGQKPFPETTEPMELIHCHIAKQPKSPGEINSKIPQMVSNIVLKLMEKNAENRYQTTFGLIFDIQNCIDQLISTDSISEFEIGTKDNLGKFQIPQKLYGRENEVQLLMDSFQRVCQGKNEMMLVSGFSGIGKSALVLEIHKSIVAQKGNFISGKFDQLKKNTPYSAIIDAFRELIKHVLTFSAKEIDKWKTNILSEIGQNGQILIDVILELEWIIGKQNPVEELSAYESQNRFNFIFQKFVSVFAQKKHPLVLFIDDLQWADSASLQLIQNLVSSDSIHYLYIIGAYRINEVDATHPLILAMDNLEKSGHTICSIFLKSLNLNDVEQLVLDTLSPAQDEIHEFSELMYNKTKGNPFYLNEFLKLLYNKNHVYFDSNVQKWKWNFKDIQNFGMSDNVVDLMVGKIKELPQNTQTILQIASCIGNQFDLSTLSILSQRSKQEIHSDLWKAMEENFILALDDSYKFLDAEEMNPKYKFLHDRIQQATYSLIQENQLKTLHITIGQLLIKNLPSVEKENRLFEITNHLNIGIELLSTDESKKQLLNLNFFSGKKAKKSAAFAQSLNYFKTTIQLMDNDSWKNNYEQTYECYLESSEVAFMNGDITSMESYVQTALENAKTTVEKAKVSLIKITSLMAMNNLPDAIKISLQVLNLLGESIPAEPTEAEIGAAIGGSYSLWTNRDVMSLLELPEMKNPEKEVALQILTTVMPIIYVVAPMLVPIFAYTMLKLSITFGNTNASTFAYATYGLILCGMGDIENGYQFGQLAVKLLDHLNAIEYKAKTYFYVYLFITHWKTHLSNSLNPLLKAYHSGLETGDITNATLGAMQYCVHSYVAGNELVELLQTMNNFSKSMKTYKQDFALSFHELYRFFVAKWVIDDVYANNNFPENYIEESILNAKNTKNISALWVIFVNKLVLNYSFQDYTKALENSIEVENYQAAASGSITLSQFCLYDSLTRLSVYSTVSESEKEFHITKVQTNQEKLDKWSKTAPMNFLHKYYLVEAEKSRVLNQFELALDFYDKAIELAHENEYIQDEALGNELVAKFWTEKGKNEIAQIYLRRAHHCYSLWGAIVKVKDLEKKHPFLLKSTREQTSNTTTLGTISSTDVTSSSTKTTTFDLTSIIKSTQLISSEIVLDNLLNKLMDVVLENAGATEGYLLFENNNQFFIEAKGTVETKNNTFNSSVEIVQNKKLIAEDSSTLPNSLINYVARTKETILLNDATIDNRYKNDPYILKNSPKSVLCLPLIQQGKISGILYLENKFLSSVFTSERVKTLRVLCSQAAISLENARLYQNMAKLNTAYERFVPKQFLEILEKKDIIEIKLGDQTQKEMSVLFSDIRDFTTLSESMSSDDNFRFINAYLKRIAPNIRKHNGFIDKYIGDAIMALFPDKAHYAIDSAIDMQSELRLYNAHRIKSGYKPITIGIGINTGNLTLGIVGDEKRMDGTVISDVVNLSSRIEGLTKVYGSSILISEHTFHKLENQDKYSYRTIGSVQVKGKHEPVTVIEIFNGLAQERIDLKLSTKQYFEIATTLFQQKDFKGAKEFLQKVLEKDKNDLAAISYFKKAEYYETHNVPDDWEGVTIFDTK